MSVMHSLSIKRPKDRDKPPQTEPERPLSPATSNSNTAPQPSTMTRKHSLSNSFKNLFVKSPKEAEHATAHHQQPAQVSPRKATSPLAIHPPALVHDDHISPLVSPTSGAPLISRELPRSAGLLEVVDEEAPSSVDHMVQQPAPESHSPHKASHPTPSSTPMGHAPSEKNRRTPVFYCDEGSLRLYEDGTHEHILKPIKPEKIPTNTGMLSGFLRKSSRTNDMNDAAFSMLPEQNRMDFQRRWSIQSRKTTDSTTGSEDADNSDDDYETDTELEEQEEAAIGDTQLSLINQLVEAIDRGEETNKDACLSEGTAPSRNYKLTEKYGKPLGIVGKGAYGTVKLVSKLDQTTKKEIFYAIKELRRKDDETSSHFSTRLTSEFVISNSLEHTNIVKTLDLMHSSAGVYSEVMEYCAGGDLYSHILKTHREGLHPLEADCFFKQILKGIEYCHSRGVAHCDIKPENVILTSCGVAKLTDFGTAAVFRTAWEHEVHLSSGACGSEPYVAPEEFAVKEYDPRPVDVWAAGVLYLTMATGTYLWPVAKVGEELYDNYLETRPSAGKTTGGRFVPIEDMRGNGGTASCAKSRKATLYGMLDPDVSQRLSVHQALKTSWVQNIKLCDAASEVAL